MSKLLGLTLAGVIATGAMLASPSESRADHKRRRSVSFGFDIGGAHFDYHRGGYHGHRGHRHYRHHHHHYPRYRSYDVIYHPGYYYYVPRYRPYYGYYPY